VNGLEERGGRVKYLLMLCSDVSDVDDEVMMAAVRAGCDGWTEEMRRRGMLLAVAGLRPSSDATTVKVRGTDVLRSDGPFAETKDQIGGFTLLECADLDEAIEVAARHPWAKAGQIELRPVWDQEPEREVQ
jgi:hypothetical protein